MRAVSYRRFGAAAEVLELGERDAPTPGSGEVQVRLRVAGVNPSDVKLRAGRRPGGVAAEMPFPRITPHSDGAGEITAVGEGVARERVGERVWLWNAQWERADGACAEVLTLPAEQAAPLPAAASFRDGACLGIPAATAHAALFGDLTADPTPGLSRALQGQTVLVTGGAGTVGRYAIQMAKLAGARVATTVSGPAKAAEAESAGADLVINYREEDVVEQVMKFTGGAGVQRIVEVEFGGNIEQTTQLIAPLGVISAYASMAEPTPRLPFYQLMFKNVTIRPMVVYRLDAAARRRAERDICAWLEAERLSHRIAAAFPLGQTAQAHEMVEAGEKIGCVLVEL